MLRGVRRSRAFRAALIVLVAAMPVAEAAAGSKRGGRTPAQRVAGLEQFYRQLAELEAGRRANVTVLQIGDSHTAADHLTGRLRQLLQKRFGNGGRGLLPPGVPHAHYKPHLVRVEQAGRWQMLTSNKPKPDAATYGLTGLVARSGAAGDAIVVEDQAQSDTFAFGYLERPDGGAFDVLFNGATQGLVDTRGTADGRKEVQISISPAFARTGSPLRIEIKAVSDAPVEITDLALTRAHGVRVINLGFIGAQVALLDRWDWPMVDAQLKALEPGLILLAFGTNEGFAATGHIAHAYRRTFEARLAALQAAAPGASIVVLGPPDANRYPKFCLPPPKVIDEPAQPASTAAAPGAPEAPATPLGPERAATSSGSDAGAAPPSAPQRSLPAAAGKRIVVPPEPPADAVCQPLSTGERQAYDTLMDARDRRLCRWHTPAALPMVREIQREVAARRGVVFWDWASLFDGECGADRWTRQDLAAKDRVHFKPAGYARAADRLYEMLTASIPAKR